MNADWQNVVVGGLVAVAAAYLAYRGWRVVAKKQAGCLGGCASCPEAGEKSEAEKTFVAVEDLRRNAASVAGRQG